MDENDVPFKAGQLVEARSFLKGYRGAWFRCKIIDIHQRDFGMLFSLQYYDFPDEKLNWTRLYQYPKPRLKNTERQLMVRPCFPSVYHESKLPEIKAISEVIVVVNDVWKVGDFVDWWTDGCYWSGRLTKALGNDKFQIDLLPPPVGEGMSYEASSKDFRPSLSWSPEDGWTVPISSSCSVGSHMLFRSICDLPVILESISVPGGDQQSSFMCAVDQTRESSMMVAGRSTNLAVSAADEGRKVPEATVRVSYKLNDLFSSHIASSSLPPPYRSELMEKGPLNPDASNETCTPGRNIGLDVKNGGAAKSSFSDSESSSHCRGASAEVAEDTGGKDRENDDFPLEEMTADRGLCLDSMCPDTIEAAILDLEVLVNRVKWMKDTLKFGMPLSNTARPSWKFLEHGRPSRPK